VATAFPATAPDRPLAGGRFWRTLDRVILQLGAGDGREDQRYGLLLNQLLIVSFGEGVLLLVGAGFRSNWQYFAPLIVLGPAAAVVLQDPRRARWGALGGLVAAAITIWLTFPQGANHLFLAFLAYSILAMMNPHDRNQGDLALAAVRWLVVIVLVWSGIQKLVGGAYFQGQFIAVEIGESGRFSGIFGALASERELNHLRQLGPPRAGGGPFRFDSWPAVLLSNAVPILEIAVGALLASKRARRIGALATLALIGAIEVGARELSFGLLMVAMLSTFGNPGLMRWGAPLISLAYATLWAARMAARQWTFF
jgi:hypothetical protein